MGEDMDDQRFEGLMREAAQAYHRPPAPPRREMWLRIQAARAAAPAAAPAPPLQPLPPLSLRPPVRPLAWITGIAALLAIGIGLGRWSIGRSGTDTAPVVAAVETTPSDREAVAAAVYRHAMAEHLGQAETFLTLFRSSLRQYGDDRLLSRSAQQLMATNRLLLNSPAAADPGPRLLLEDVELVLARIIQLSPSTNSEDRELITSGMDQAGVLARLRMETPTGPEALTARGVL